MLSAAVEFRAQLSIKLCKFPFIASYRSINDLAHRRKPDTSPQLLSFEKLFCALSHSHERETAFVPHFGKLKEEAF